MNTKMRITKFKDIMGTYINPDITAWLMREGFFTVPASTKYHGAYEGGLFDHSLAVTETLVELTAKNELDWWREESPYLIGMFHDLCKIDQYEHPIVGENNARDPEKWCYCENTRLKGHGDKSICVMDSYGRHDSFTNKKDIGGNQNEVKI